MTHDFARQRAARASRAAKPASPPWLWFLSGVVTGTLCSFLVYLATLAPQPLARVEGAAVAPAKAPGDAKTAVPAEKPQFDFYTILPESEVIVPERSHEDPAPEPGPATRAPAETAASGTPAAGKAAATAKSEPPKPKPAEVSEPPALLLQAGSFRAFADADRRRASIILLGFPARVETVNVRGGETWYRVQVGPFASARALGAARTALDAQGITTVEIGRRA
jgi:cell division protein FtsN